MEITFTYLRKDYTRDGETKSMELLGIETEVCYPSQPQNLWMFLFEHSHYSPLFYAIDQTPVLGVYKKNGRSIISQVLYDLEKKELVQDFRMRKRSGNLIRYRFIGVSSIRLAKSVLFLK